MIKEKEIFINGHRTNYDYFKKLGYPIEFKKPCLIKVEHLLPGSSTKITTICDNCLVENFNSFKDYYIYTEGLTKEYFCKKCNNIKRKKTCLAQ